MPGKADKKTGQESEETQQQGTQHSRFGGVPTPARPEDADLEGEIVDQDPGERQKRNQGDIEEDKLAS